MNAGSIKAAICWYFVFLVSTATATKKLLVFSTSNIHFIFVIRNKLVADILLEAIKLGAMLLLLGLISTAT